MEERNLVLHFSLKSLIHFLIQDVKGKSTEVEFVKNKYHIIYKFNKLQTSLTRDKKKQIKSNYAKPIIIYFMNIA